MKKNSFLRRETVVWFLIIILIASINYLINIYANNSVSSLPMSHYIDILITFALVAFTIFGITVMFENEYSEERRDSTIFLLFYLETIIIWDDDFSAIQSGLGIMLLGFTMLAIKKFFEQFSFYKN